MAGRGNEGGNEVDRNKWGVEESREMTSKVEDERVEARKTTQQFTYVEKKKT